MWVTRGIQGLGSYLQWTAIASHSSPPYHLTLKSNGCLILISALSPRHLLVASKHSLGTSTEASEAATSNLINGVAALQLNGHANHVASVPNGERQASSELDADENEADAQQHAAVGRQWLRETLRKSGKTEAQLASRLWSTNQTAVLEVRCRLSDWFQLLVDFLSFVTISSRNM